MARPLSFNPEEKLRDAMFIFWEKGYSKASINQLSAQLGINKFSIYKQFGSKDDFYLKALRYYHDTIFVTLLEPLEKRQGIDSVLRYFDNFSIQVSKANGASGCLINNTLLADNNAPEESLICAKKMVGELRVLLKDNFEIAAQRDQIQENPKDCLNFTLMNIQALLNTRRTLGPLLMQNNINFLIRRIRQW